MSQTTEGSNGVIQADLTGGADSNRTVDKQWNVTQAVGTTTGPLAQNTQTAKKTHNGVTWTYKNPAVASSTGRQEQAQTDNSITIEGKVNIYKAKSGQNGYQTYFAVPSSDSATPKEVTVKITLVPASPASSGRSTK